MDTTANLLMSLRPDFPKLLALFPAIMQRYLMQVCFFLLKSIQNHRILALYDAIFLYGLALRDAYDETKNQTIYLNGGLIWKKMTGKQFIGATGQVLSKSLKFHQKLI